MEGIPTNSIDSHVMRVEGIQELVAVRFRALVNLSLFGANDEQIILLFVEVEARATSCRTKGRRGRKRR